MKPPKANQSKEAQNLRWAASAWSYHRIAEDDVEDVAGQKLNITLLQAAVAYAKVAQTKRTKPRRLR